MYRYIVKRLLLAIPTLVGAAALVFILMRLIPGDICVIRMGAGGSHVDAAAVALCHQQLGLDNSMFVQFLDFLWSYFTFNFGNSMWSGNPVAQEIALRLPVSLEVAVLATVIAILIAIPLGTLSALKENTWLDHAVRVAAIAGIDRLVLSVRKGWFSDNAFRHQFCPSTAIGLSLGPFAPRAVLAEDGYFGVSTHELGHTYNLSQHACSNQSPPMFLSKRVVPHTPPSFVKLKSRAFGEMTGAGSSVPRRDHVPELMKAVVSPPRTDATAEPVS